MKMSNPFKNFEFKEEKDRDMVLKNFDLLYRVKSDKFPKMKLMQVYAAFKEVLPDFDMSLEDLKNHLDALADAPNSDVSKKGDEYFMGMV